MTQITETIYKQIGHKAFYMMGSTKKIVTDDKNNALMFRIKGNKAFNHVTVKLNGLDLYDVTFTKIGGKKTFYEIKKQETIENVYADMLHQTIENKTGLYLSL